MDAIALLVMLAFSPVLPIAAAWGIVRYGPVPNKWHRREHPIGFALTVGAAAFLVGFVGPMIFSPGANQGPLLGILITGPAGLVVGLLWGLWRARQRAGNE